MQIVSYGAGTNSTALLIEMWKRGEKVDAITFADTGGERAETYDHVRLFSAWCIARGLPEIVTVKKGGKVETLEENCLRMKMLPSVVYGFKSCSLKYKAEPQDKFYNNYEPAREEWAAGRKIVKCLGFDAGEPQRAKPREDGKYICRYPLVEWGIDRDGCVASIIGAGLPLPGKSSCFFCPNSKPAEILAMPRDLQDRAIAMERNAELTHMKGLGRLWRWEDLIRSDRDQLKLFNTHTEMPCECYDG